jgi:hypothetical protein
MPGEAAYFGVVYNVDTKEITCIINPDYDAQLDFASWTASEDATLAMLRIVKADLGFGPGDIDPLVDTQTIIDFARNIIGGA